MNVKSCLYVIEHAMIIITDDKNLYIGIGVGCGALVIIIIILIGASIRKK